jgi:PPM family protein phosphatase
MSAKKETNASSDDPTAEYPAVAPTKELTPRPSPSPTPDVGAATHTGYVRQNNEDHYLVVRFQRSLETVSTNLDDAMLKPSYSSTGYGLLVADGMGGMAAGEVASRLALARLVELVVETPDWIMSLDEESVTRVLSRMSHRFMQVDKTLKAQVALDPGLSGMGTTLTVAAALGDDLVVGHIGDSRAYLLRDGKLTQLTHDHTLAQALIDAGIAKPDDPNTTSIRHVLTAAMGALKGDVAPQQHRLHLNIGDQILLCTDGLTDMVEDSNIASILHEETSSAQTACDKLIERALAGGGKDNITVIVARF